MIWAKSPVLLLVSYVTSGCMSLLNFFPYKIRRKKVSIPPRDTEGISELIPHKELT